MPEITTFAELYQIQQRQIAEWGTVLKPEVLEALRKAIAERTDRRPNEAQPVDFKRGEDYDYPRGGTIYEVLFNVVRPMFSKKELAERLRDGITITKTKI
jgi:hypothetical protein